MAPTIFKQSNGHLRISDSAGNNAVSGMDCTSTTDFALRVSSISASEDSDEWRLDEDPPWLCDTQTRLGPNTRKDPITGALVRQRTRYVFEGPASSTGQATPARPGLLSRMGSAFRKSDAEVPRSSSSSFGSKQELLGQHFSYQPRSCAASDTSDRRLSLSSIPWLGVSRADEIKLRRSTSDERKDSAAHMLSPSHNMLSSVCKPANEGTGTKARRSSYTVHGEIRVDHCPLAQEFKCTSLLPWKRGRLLGRGATATVRIMASRGSTIEQLYAVKQFRARDDREPEAEYVKKVKSEYTIAKSCHHPNIVKAVRLCTSADRWDHVMELCDHGELFALLERRYLTVHDKNCLFKQLLRGVDYMHSRGIAHRDLKPENLLLTKGGCLKITDFGVSEVFSGPHPGIRTDEEDDSPASSRAIRKCAPGACGSLPYVSPEVLRAKESYDPRALDVWSCGIIYITMAFVGNPWMKPSSTEKNFDIFVKGWQTWLDTHPDGVIRAGTMDYPRCGLPFQRLDDVASRRLILMMLHPIADRRCTIGEALQSRLVRSWDCCQTPSYEAPGSVRRSAAARRRLPKHDHTPPKGKVSKWLIHETQLGSGWTRYD